MTIFEWDENKRDANIKKHGIDFIDAVEMFNHKNRIEEKRYQTMGIMDKLVIVLIYTLRNEKKRIISARKASQKERELYNAGDNHEK